MNNIKIKSNKNDSIGNWRSQFTKRKSIVSETQKDTYEKAKAIDKEVSKKKTAMCLTK